MILIILIVFFTIVALLTLHELGHFLMAKKFGVKVEEFGFGYPPRIYGKKIGETIYSINLLPFGAFVKMMGEEKKVEHSKSFSQKPLWQRGLIIIGGVVSFWLIGIVIFSILAATWGLPTSIPDDFNGALRGAQVQIVAVDPNSPAAAGGIQMGDTIKELKIKNEKSFDSTQNGELVEPLKIDKIGQVQDFTGEHLGEEIILTVERGKELFEISLTPRISPPEGEGAMGIALARVAKLKYSWYKAPFQGVLVTFRQTVQIPIILGTVLVKAIRGEKVQGVRMIGIVGLGDLMGQALKRGFDNFLMFVAMISVWLALFNLFPIPALDGGKLLFLGIEGVRRKPVSQLIEQKITAVFFFLLIGLMIFVTIKDIIRLL